MFKFSRKIFFDFLRLRILILAPKVLIYQRQNNCIFASNYPKDFTNESLKNLQNKFKFASHVV